MSTAPKDRRRANPAGAPQNWSTPRLLVADLAHRHAAGAFDIDCAADATNHVAPLWLGPGSPVGDDALSLPWGTAERPLRGFLNPPWNDVHAFAEHGIAEVEAGHLVALVCVLPCRADARWWRWMERPPSGVTSFRDDVEGRIAYVDPLGLKRAAPAEGTTVWVLRPTLRAANYRLRAAHDLHRAHGAAAVNGERE